MLNKVRHLTEQEVRRSLAENKLPKAQLDIEMRYNHIAVTVPCNLIQAKKYTMKYSLSNLGFHVIAQNYAQLRMFQIIVGLGGSSVASENENIESLVKISLVIRLMIMTLNMDKRDPIVQLILPIVSEKQLPNSNQERFRDKWEMITLILSEVVKVPAKMPSLLSQEWVQVVSDVVLTSIGLRLQQFQGKYHFERASFWEKIQLDLHKYIAYSTNVCNLSNEQWEVSDGVCGICTKVGCVKQVYCCRCTATRTSGGHRAIFQPIDTQFKDVFLFKKELPWEVKQIDFTAVDRILECLGFDGGHRSESKMIKSNIARLWKVAVVSMDDVSSIRKLFRVDLMGAIRNKNDISLIGAKLKILLALKGLRFSKRKCGKCLRYYRIVKQKNKKTS